MQANLMIMMTIALLFCIDGLAGLSDLMSKSHVKSTRHRRKQRGGLANRDPGLRTCSGVCLTEPRHHRQSDTFVYMKVLYEPKPLAFLASQRVGMISPASQA